MVISYNKCKCVVKVTCQRTHPSWDLILLFYCENLSCFSSNCTCLFYHTSTKGTVTSTVMRKKQGINTSQIFSMMFEVS